MNYIELVGFIPRSLLLMSITLIKAKFQNINIKIELFHRDQLKARTSITICKLLRTCCRLKMTHQV